MSIGESEGISIERGTLSRLEDWIALRQALWPEAAAEELRHGAEALMNGSRRAAFFLALTVRQGTVGFAEATLRTDYVNGCDTSPVGFLEGIYVQPNWRRRGVARRLSAAVEDWAAGMGCSELASDALLENTGSHRMHTALGFEETERVVYYRKQLSPRGGCVSTTGDG
jgi:aminoglycoside 6'-N-acetyltransferase I